MKKYLLLAFLLLPVCVDSMEDTKTERAQAWEACDQTQQAKEAYEALKEAYEDLEKARIAEKEAYEVLKKAHKAKAFEKAKEAHEKAQKALKTAEEVYGLAYREAFKKTQKERYIRLKLYKIAETMPITQGKANKPKNNKIYLFFIPITIIAVHLIYAKTQVKKKKRKKRCT